MKSAMKKTQTNNKLIETEDRFVVARAKELGGWMKWVTVVKRYKFPVIK